MVYPWRDGGFVKRYKFNQKKLELFSKGRSLVLKYIGFVEKQRFCQKIDI